MQCFKIDRFVKLDNEEWLKHSAIVIGIAEKYPCEKFEIFWSDESGFYVKLAESGYRRIRYEDYELRDDVLLWVGDMEFLKPKDTCTEK